MPLKSRQNTFRPISLPANQLKTSPSLPPSLSPASLPLPSRAENDEIVLKAEGGVKSEAAKGIRRLRSFWLTALNGC